MAGISMRLILSFVFVHIAARSIKAEPALGDCIGAEPAVEARESQSVQVRARMTTGYSFLRTCDPTGSGRYNWPPSQENCPVIKRVPKGSYVTPFCIMPGQPVGTPPNRDLFWVYVEFSKRRGFMPDFFIKCANTPDVCGMYNPTSGRYNLCSGRCCPSYVSASTSPFDITPVNHEWAQL